MTSLVFCAGPLLKNQKNSRSAQRKIAGSSQPCKWKIWGSFRRDRCRQACDALVKQTRGLSLVRSSAQIQNGKESPCLLLVLVQARVPEQNTIARLSPHASYYLPQHERLTCRPSILKPSVSPSRRVIHHITTRVRRETSVPDASPCLCTVITASNWYACPPSTPILLARARVSVNFLHTLQYCESDCHRSYKPRGRKTWRTCRHTRPSLSARQHVRSVTWTVMSPTF